MLFAQAYVPFISTSDSSDTWMDVNSCTDFNCYYSYTNRYTIDGDTTIGGVQYAKIHLKYKYEEGADQGQWCNESVNYYDNYFGAIRESGKKLYVIPYYSADSAEYLAYDFNLTVGDTVPSPTDLGVSVASNRIITSIDSVLVFGTYRKRYLITPYRFIIEGIGASTGLFNPIDVISSMCAFEMLCYAEYGTPDYFVSNCNMNLSVNALSNESEPAQLVRIIDYLGREVEFKPNTPLIYMYSDGTIEKVFRLE